MEDVPDPHQVNLNLIHFIQSPWVELAGKVLLLMFLLFVSSFSAAIETALESFSGNKRSNDPKHKSIQKNLIELKASLFILQFALKTGAGITIAEILRQLLNITNLHFFYAMVLFFVFVAVVFGNWLVLLVPQNRKFHENPAILGALIFITTLMSPLSNTLAGSKKFFKNSLKKKGYIKIEPIKEETKEQYTSLAKAAEEFNFTTVKQVMRSRMDITAFNMEIGFHELLNNLNKFGFSRVPVFRETIDKIEGILYIKDLLPYIGKSDEFPWQNLLRPAYFVPENKKIEELLREFQEKHAHMALVVDGYGGISGLITLEDILEEIVGEINDELDEIDLNYIKLDDKAYIFEAKTSLNDFCKVVGIDHDFFEEVKGESESLGGVLLQLNSDLPKKGDKIFYKNFVFRIDSANNKRIKKIKVEVLQENEVNQDAEN